MSTRNCRVRFMDLPRMGSTNTTGATASAGFPFSNAFTTFRHEVWRPATNTQTLVVDLGTAQPVNFFGMVGPLEEVFSLTQNATVRIQANNLNDFTAPPFAKTLSVTDRGVFAFFDDVVDTRYRFWQIYIEDARNPNTIEIGHIYLGDYTTLTQSNVKRGFSANRVDPTAVLASKDGSEFFDVQNSYLTYTGVSMVYLKAEDRRRLERLFYEYSVHTPLFVSLDPVLKISNELTEYTRFMRFVSQPTVTHITSDIFSVSLSLKEVF